MKRPKLTKLINELKKYQNEERRLAKSAAKTKKDMDLFIHISSSRKTTPRDKKRWNTLTKRYQSLTDKRNKVVQKTREVSKKLRSYDYDLEDKELKI